MQAFNKKEYESIKRRKEKLEDRILRDVPGYDVDTAKQLLKRVEKRLREYEATHDIPKEEHIRTDFNVTGSDAFWEYCNQSMQSNTYQSAWEPDERNFDFKWQVHFDDERYAEEFRSEDELFRDIGVLYLIFGSTYQTYVNYHIYKVRFLKKLEPNGAFMRVRVNVYEDDILICREIVIEFWAFRRGDDFVGDMNCSIFNYDSMRKYNNGGRGYLHKIMWEMKDLWNSYFEEAKRPLMIGMGVAGYITDNKNNNEVDLSLTEQQRLEVIEKVEKKLRMMQMPKNGMTYWLQAYEPYDSLAEMLELSGLAYQVTRENVLIWTEDREAYWKLVWISEYDKFGGGHYVLYLLPNLPF